MIPRRVNIKDRTQRRRLPESMTTELDGRFIENPVLREESTVNTGAEAADMSTGDGERHEHVQHAHFIHARLTSGPTEGLPWLANVLTRNCNRLSSADPVTDPLDGARQTF